MKKKLYRSNHGLICGVCQRQSVDRQRNFSGNRNDCGIFPTDGLRGYFGISDFGARDA